MTTTQTDPKVQRWAHLAQQLRVDSIRCTTAAGSGHPTSSMSAADLMAVLLTSYLRYDFDHPQHPNTHELRNEVVEELIPELVSPRDAQRDVLIE